jgi:UDP:flavonoid glycosyltransferase YjiC (YdhE family)
VADRIGEAVRRCIDDSAYRERLCQQERALVDGSGAHRIAEQIRALCRRA